MSYVHTYACKALRAMRVFFLSRPASHTISSCSTNCGELYMWGGFSRIAGWHPYFSIDRSHFYYIPRFVLFSFIIYLWTYFSIHCRSSQFFFVLFLHNTLLSAIVSSLVFFDLQLISIE